MDTQNIEGINSVIQVMCKKAPNMKIPLLNSRISMKKNVQLQPRYLTEIDHQVSDYMQEHIAIAITFKHNWKQYKLCKPA